MEKSLDNICLHHEIAREQRKTELYNGSGLKGTQGYEDMGCYKCTGYNFNCDAYLTRKMLCGDNNDFY